MSVPLDATFDAPNPIPTSDLLDSIDDIAHTPT